MLQIANNPRKRAKRFWGLFCGGCGGKTGGAMIILYCGIVNGVKNKKHKKQP